MRSCQVAAYLGDDLEGLLFLGVGQRKADKSDAEHGPQGHAHTSPHPRTTAQTRSNT